MKTETGIGPTVEYSQSERCWIALNPESQSWANLLNEWDKYLSACTYA